MSTGVSVGRAVVGGVTDEETTGEVDEEVEVALRVRLELPAAAHAPNMITATTSALKGVRWRAIRRIVSRGGWMITGGQAKPLQNFPATSLPVPVTPVSLW